MKKGFLMSVIVLAALSLSAQSKIAVLDASLGKGIHINAAAIVADTINEQFVKASNYIAIDRAYVSTIQAEKQFQLSGDVNDSDIKEIGNTFGADFICIANVSLLGSTYTVSARLIEVETAQVVSQESHRAQGEIDVLFEIAEVVGQKMVGEEGIAEADTAAEITPVKPEQKTEEIPLPIKEEFQPRANVSASIMIPGIAGYPDQYLTDSEGTTEYTVLDITNYFQSLATGDEEISQIDWGLDVSLFYPINFIYFGGGVSYTSSSLDYYNSYTADSFTNGLWTTTLIRGGGGVVFPFLDFIQVYGGLNIGYFFFTYGDQWADEGETASGITYGFELGGDIFLGEFLATAKFIGVVAPSTWSPNIFNDDYTGSTILAQSGLMIGLGYAF